MLSCEEVTQLVSESLDRQLPLGQRVAVRMHFLFCKACARYKKQLRFLRDAVHRFPVDFENKASPTGPALSPEARERIKRSLRGQSR